jgi:hypothetical protein
LKSYDILNGPEPISMIVNSEEVKEESQDDLWEEIMNLH